MVDANASPDVAAAEAAAGLPLTQRPLLTREEILGADDVRFEIVPTDEWRPGSAVRVCSLTAFARDALEEFLAEQRKPAPAAPPEGAPAAGTPPTVPKERESIRAFFASLCVVDAQNVPLFTYADVKALGRKDAKPIDRIFEAAQRLNDISDNEVAREAGNSESGATDTSSSPLP